MERSENIQVNVAPDGCGCELVIRHGDALPPVKPLALRIIGDINAPAEYVRKRAGIINPNTTHVLINRERGAIVLHLNEDTELQGTVIGTMDYDSDFEKFRINGADWESPKALGEFLRKNRVFADDPAQYANLVGKLLNFQATVSKQIQKSDDNRGNKREMAEQSVVSDIPATFVLNMPIYKGQPNVRFEVEIFFDIRDAGCKVSLQSIEAEEARRRLIQGSIDDLLPVFDQFVTVFE